MAICAHCLVELGDDVAICPLCRHHVGKDPHSAEASSRHASAGHPAAAGGAPAACRGDGSFPSRALDPEDFDALSAGQKKRVFVEVYSTCMLIALSVVVAVNLVVNRSLSWSLYPAASIIFVWICSCAPVVLARRPVPLVIILGLSLPLYIMTIASIMGGIDWFMRLALPIVVVVELASGIVVFASITAKRKGLNVIGFALVGVTSICVAVELIVRAWLGAGFGLAWSAVVAVAGLPVAMLLFFLHFRVTKRASLRKLFRV